MIGVSTATAFVPLAATLMAALAPGTDPSPHVEVLAQLRSGPSSNGACLREAVTGLLAGRGIPVRWANQDQTVPSDDSAAHAVRRVSLEIDLTEPTRAALSFHDSAGGPAQLREVALDHGLDQVGCESVADVIEASVLAMTATRPIAPAPTSVAAPPATIARTPRPDAAFIGERPALALAYTLEPVASDIVQSGLELALGSRPRAYRRRLWLRLSYTFPATASADLVSARWQSVSAGLWGSASSRGRRAWFELASGLGVNLTFQETRSPGAGTSVTSDRHTEVSPLLATEFTFAVRVAPIMSVFASLRFALVSSPPVILEANGMDVFITWWMIRPVFLLGARWQ